MLLENNLAYTISNENQRWATQVVPNVKSVLTVAGSGDQALFYRLAGAKIVDTFDITCNARVIQDIKCAAIKHFDTQEYKDLLIKLHHYKDIMSLPKMQFLGQFLPAETQEIIKNTKSGCWIFGLGLDASFYPENIPIKTEYSKLKSILDEPFNFIWSDLESVGAKLTKKYDLINISNIFDYVHSGEKQVNILNELSTHLNNNGYIVCLPQVHRYSYKKLKLPHLSYERTEHDEKHTKAIVFQRTR